MQIVEGTRGGSFSISRDYGLNDIIQIRKTTGKPREEKVITGRDEKTLARKIKRHYGLTIRRIDLDGNNEISDEELEVLDEKLELLTLRSEFNKKKGSLAFTLKHAYEVIAKKTASFPLDAAAVEDSGIKGITIVIPDLLNTNDRPDRWITRYEVVRKADGTKDQYPYKVHVKNLPWLKNKGAGSQINPVPARTNHRQRRV